MIGYEYITVKDIANDSYEFDVGWPVIGNHDLKMLLPRSIFLPAL